MGGLISVIIPTYRRANMLREAILSVKMQDYPHIEIIVVDDNSWEETSKTADEFPDVIFLRNDENRGPGYSRKKGFEHSRGEYVVFLDDDDYYTDESFFSRCVELFQEREDATVVIADVRILDVATETYRTQERDRYGWMLCKDYLQEYNIKSTTLSTFPAMFSKRMLLKSGIQDMQMVNDMALYMRSFTNGYVYFLKAVIGIYRVHAANISKHITGNFVIANLEEKLTVYKTVVEQNLFENFDQWWLQQMEVTVSYYVCGSHPTFSDLNKVRKWCISNSVKKAEVREKFDKYRSYLVDYRICKLKCAIKKFLGMSVE